MILDFIRSPLAKKTANIILPVKKQAPEMPQLVARKPFQTLFMIGSFICDFPIHFLYSTSYNFGFYTKCIQSLAHCISSNKRPGVHFELGGALIGTRAPHQGGCGEGVGLIRSAHW